MAALSFGFDELERRLEIIRRRHNLYALQDAFCKAGATVLGGGAIVLAVAGFASETYIRPALSFYLAVALGITAHYALRVRRHWLSLADAAELADREARLDCRLATLLAQRSSSSRSRLRALLLAQVFLLASQWTAQRIAPPRFPRSLTAFAAALLVFLTTLLLAPAPPEPPATAGITAPSGAAAPQLAAAQSIGSSEAGPAGAEPVSGADGPSAGNASAAPRSGGGTVRSAGAEPGVAGNGTGAGEGSARSEEPTDDTAPGAGHPAPGELAGASSSQHSKQRSPQGVDDPTSPRDGEHQLAAAPKKAEAREESPVDRDRRRQNAHTAAEKSRSERAPDKTEGRERAASSQYENGDAQRTDPAGRRSQQQPDKGRDSGRQNPGDDTSRGGSRADHGAESGPAEKSGLYGTPKGDAAPPSDAAAMLIKLTAFSAVAPQEFERQGKGVAGDVAADQGEDDAETPVAAQINRETPLLRAPLAVEHESIVRDIFTPR